MLSKLGAIAYAGAIPCIGVDAVIERAASLLASFVTNWEQANEVAARAHGLIDGRGAQRIAEEIAQL